MFHLNYERKDLALRVTVNNMNEDDAYEAKLVGTFPDTLSYSGVRSHQTTVNKTREKMYMMILMMLYGRPIKLNRQSNHLKTALTSHHTTLKILIENRESTKIQYEDLCPVCPVK